MEDLIEALQILQKYMPADVRNPTNCEHDEFRVMVDPSDVSTDDMARLNALGFVPSDETMLSFRFGSC